MEHERGGPGGERRSSERNLSRKYTSCWAETGEKFVEPRPGKGNGKGRRLVQKSNVKREGSRCNQAPGSTLVRKEIHGVTRAFALARIVPGKLPGSSAHLVCWRVPHRPVAPVLGIAAPQSREIPAGAGC